MRTPSFGQRVRSSSTYESCVSFLPDAIKRFRIRAGPRSTCKTLARRLALLLCACCVVAARIRTTAFLQSRRISSWSRAMRPLSPFHEINRSTVAGFGIRAKAHPAVPWDSLAVAGRMSNGHLADRKSLCIRRRRLCESIWSAARRASQNNASILLKTIMERLKCGNTTSPIVLVMLNHRSAGAPYGGTGVN